MSMLTKTIICLLSINFSCYSQNNKADIDFIKSVNKEDVTYTSFEISKSDVKYKFSVPYYEQNVTEIKIGLACIFAISKEFPEKWTEDALKNPNGECNKIGDYYDSYYVRCQSKRFFLEDTAKLKSNFDIYVFFIDRNELNGPFVETVEGGKYENYFPKVGSTIIVYRYSNGYWLEIDRQKQEGDGSPKRFGMKYMQRLAEIKVTEYLENR